MVKKSEFKQALEFKLGTEVTFNDESEENENEDEVECECEIEDENNVFIRFRLPKLILNFPIKYKKFFPFYDKIASS